MREWVRWAELWQSGGVVGVSGIIGGGGIVNSGGRMISGERRGRWNSQLKLNKSQLKFNWDQFHIELLKLKLELKDELQLNVGLLKSDWVSWDSD